jgi:ribonuclease HI
MPLPLISIFTDGACLGNPGPGGWAAVILAPSGRSELSGGFQHTTNNRMELMAAIEGLKALRQPSRIKLFSDSRYVVDAIMLGWARSWQAKKWRNASRQKVLNPDLWRTLLTLCEVHQVEFIWLQGHAGDRENERCDYLSNRAAKGRNLPEDDGYGFNSPPTLF